MVWVLGCLAIAWAASQDRWWTGLPPLGLLLVAAGAVSLLYHLDRRRRASTWYALTESRALVYQGHPRAQLLSLDLQSARDVGVVRRMDGSGTIAFGSAWPHSLSVFGDRPVWGSLVRQGPAAAFELVDDVRGVHAEVMRLKSSERATPPPLPH